LWLVCRNRAGTSRDCPSSLRGAGRQAAGVAQEVVPAEILASPSSGIRPFRRLWPEPARLRAREVVRFAPRTSCHRRRCSDHRRTPAPAVLGRNTPRDAPRHPWRSAGILRVEAYPIDFRGRLRPGGERPRRTTASQGNKRAPVHRSPPPGLRWRHDSRCCAANRALPEGQKWGQTRGMISTRLARLLYHP
jgi:hypothetical protein